jgi:hypothetical protein
MNDGGARWPIIIKRTEKTTEARIADAIGEIQADYYGVAQFISVIEQQTGERVMTFVSTTHLEDAVAVEVFPLAGRQRTDMAAFERSQAVEIAPRLKEG